jgi:hypothetical protein
MNLLLVHGLWRTPVSFLLLVRRLRQWGHTPHQFGYAAVAQRYDDIVARLVQRMDSLAGLGTYAVIGHSLGGVLLRSALPRLSGDVPRHLIMLGTPNRAPRLARTLGVYWVFRRLMGECGVNLSSPAFYQTLPIPSVPYTVIAGTAGPRGRWSPFGDEPNDGIVAVGETPILDDDPIILVRASHTFMMNHPATQEAIREVLSGVTSIT